MSGFNLLIYNVNTTHLARTYRGIPSGWGAIPPSPVGPEMGTIRTSGLRPSVHIPISGPPGIRWYCPPSRRYSPIRPRQMCGILSMFFICRPAAGRYLRLCILLEWYVCCTLRTLASNLLQITLQRYPLPPPPEGLDSTRVAGTF